MSGLDFAWIVVEEECTHWSARVETLRSGLKIEWLGIGGNGTIHHYSYSSPTNVQGKELCKDNQEEKQIHFGVLVKLCSLTAFWEGLN
jgi:hypothetical protein